ncbi:hypothetical protein FA95DRAFT_763630 [Auriscalpium vulgare]|uniref:Uncharacterized protein n=1 Tax=Auriscalpium vulgare TaxID=40419 RepID=A0ACB8S1G1_9AGAM|nr:hypothetical protein FA95DRAFT_763630 [Auriscalpium vulgare]
MPLTCKNPRGHYRAGPLACALHACPSHRPRRRGMCKSVDVRHHSCAFVENINFDGVEAAANKSDSARPKARVTSARVSSCGACSSKKPPEKIPPWTALLSAPQQRRLVDVGRRSHAQQMRCDTYMWRGCRRLHAQRGDGAGPRFARPRVFDLPQFPVSLMWPQMRAGGVQRDMDLQNASRLYMHAGNVRRRSPCVLTECSDMGRSGTHRPRFGTPIHCCNRRAGKPRRRRPYEAHAGCGRRQLRVRVHR